MANLSGSLDGFGLAAILRVLGRGNKSGRLHISQESLDDPEWSAELLLECGQVVAAFYGAARGLGAMPSRALCGLAALDAVVLALPNAAFFFVEGTPPPERNIVLAAQDVQTRLATLEEERLTFGTAVPSLGAVPCRIELPEQPADGQEIVFDRGRLHLFLAIDGRRTIADLINERDLLRTLRDLTWLERNGLIRLKGELVSHSAPQVPPRVIA
jgi:hypothetical protein